MAGNNEGVYRRRFWVGSAVLLGCLAGNASATDSGGGISSNKTLPFPAEEDKTGSIDDLGSRSRKQFLHEVTLSADYLVGYGHVTLPFGLAIANSPFLSIGPAQFLTGERDSRFSGLTAGYQWGKERQWYAEVSYSQGKTDAIADGASLTPSPNQFFPMHYVLKEDRYQGYLAYTFPGLRGSGFAAYARMGVRQVVGDIAGDADFLGFSRYQFKDDTSDIIGTLGGGIKYVLLPTSETRPLSVGIQIEGEGFFGHRSQDITESLNQGSPIAVSVRNDLYGAIGRSTLDIQYYLGKSARIRLFSQAGVEVKYTKIQYAGLGLGDELLWGPYVKLGVRLLW